MRNTNTWRMSDGSPGPLGLTPEEQYILSLPAPPHGRNRSQPQPHTTSSPILLLRSEFHALCAAAVSRGDPCIGGDDDDDDDDDDDCYGYGNGNGCDSDDDSSSSSSSSGGGGGEVDPGESVRVRGNTRGGGPDDVDFARLVLHFLDPPRVYGDALWGDEEDDGEDEIFDGKDGGEGDEGTKGIDDGGSEEVSSMVVDRDQDQDQEGGIRVWGW